MVTWFVIFASALQRRAPKEEPRINRAEGGPVGEHSSTRILRAGQLIICLHSSCAINCARFVLLSPSPAATR